MLVLLLLLGLAFLIGRHYWARLGAGGEFAPPPAAPRVANTARAEGRSLTLSEAAFRYARAVLEVNELSAATKSHALRLLAEQIVPLVGPLALDDLTQLWAGVRGVLEKEIAEEGDRAVLVVWDDFVRWSGVHLRSPSG